MANLGVAGIVPEELKEENYEFWKMCLKTYLMGQGLWDVISKEDAKPRDKDTYEYKEWEQKNSAAVHAILLACGKHVYSKHKKETIESATYTWDHLAEKRLRLPPPPLEVPHHQEEHPDTGYTYRFYLLIIYTEFISRLYILKMYDLLMYLV